MLKKDVIGIYLEENALYYASARWELKGWVPRRITQTGDSSGSIMGKTLPQLGNFLKGLPSPKTTRFYVGLPRDLFFVRDMNLPLMPIEDALKAAENNLRVSSHLSINEIYYDIKICVTDNKIKAIVVYAPQKVIKPYLLCFKDAGLQKSLKAIFPISFGIGAWLKMDGFPLPFGVRLKQQENEELAVFGKDGVLASVVWSSRDSQEDMTQDIAINGVISEFPEISDKVFCYDNENASVFSLLSINKMGAFTDIKKNLAIAAMSSGLCPSQIISIDEKPAKVKVFKPVWVTVPLIIILCIIAYFITDYLKTTVIYKKQEIITLKKDVRSLNNKLKPLEKKKIEEKNAVAFKADVNDFVDTRLDIFSLINSIAQNVPDDTWFTRFTYNNNAFVLNGESPDVLKTVDALRESNLFEQVKMTGTVSRSRSGKERFAMKIILKKE